MTSLTRWVISHARFVVVASGLAFLFAGAAGAGVASRLSTGGFDDPSSEAARTEQFVEEKFRAGRFELALLVGGTTGGIDEPSVAAAGTQLAEELRASEGVSEVLSYWELGVPALRNNDGTQALILAGLEGDEDQVVDLAEQLSARFGQTTDVLEVQVGGSAEALRLMVDQIERDLIRAELIVMPITAVLLIIVFRGVLAAALPLLIGGFAVAGTTLALTAVSVVTDVSVFALNMAVGMGLGLSIDYSLFVVSRFREELAAGSTVDEAVMRTSATAGRTVLISAIAVAVSMGALWLFPLPLLRSFAFAGIPVVILAGAATLITLPALLTLIGTRIDKWSFGSPRSEAKPVTAGFWYRTTSAVMRRPVIIALGVTAVLLMLAVPFRRIDLGLPDDRVLREGHPGRAVNDQIRDQFPTNEAFPVMVAAPELPGSSPATAIVASQLSTLNGVSRVDSAAGSFVLGAEVLEDPRITSRYNSPSSTWFSVVLGVEPYSQPAERIVREIRQLDTDAALLVGGASARLLDTESALIGRLPLAAAVIGLTTVVVLFMMFGSVIIPVKALALNLLSLTATFGAMVWVFQDGHLASFLDFTPTGSVLFAIPMLMFAIAFGVSMDYEVFVLSRIKEEYDRIANSTPRPIGDSGRLADWRRQANIDSIATGLQRSGKIISATSLLLAAVFAVFATSEVAVIKLFGIGLALAVLLDATLVRATLIPAVMRLAGPANWWAPAPLRDLHQRFGIGERPLAPLPVPPSAAAIPVNASGTRWVRSLALANAVVLFAALTVLGFDAANGRSDAASSATHSPSISSATTGAPAAPSSDPVDGTPSSLEPTTPPAIEPPDETTTAELDTTTSTMPNIEPPSASFHPIAAGVYEYTTTGNTRLLGGPPSAMPETTSLEALPADGNGRQTLVRRLRDSAGNGVVTTWTLRYTGELIALEGIEIDASYGGFAQRENLVAVDTVVLTSSTARAGHRASGTLSGQGTAGTIVIDLLRVDADTTDMRITMDLTGDFTGTIVNDSRARAGDRLILNERVDSNIRAGLFTAAMTYEATLRG